MGNMEAKTYTLAEAQRELAIRECRSGHAFDWVETRTIAGGTGHIYVKCSRCNWSGHAKMTGPDPSRIDR